MDHRKSGVKKKVAATPSNKKAEEVVIKKEAGPLDKYQLWIALFLFAICFALYYPTLNYQYVMDDGAVITDNKTTIKGFSAIPQLFKESSVYGSTGENFGTYRPLVMATYAVEWGLYPNNPAVPHLLNIILYGLCCVVLFKTLSRLFKNYNAYLPLVSVLLFAVHPLHTEVVANIKSRDEIISMLLLFATLNRLLIYQEGKNKKDLLLAYLAFFGALFSKESAITFLFVIPFSLWTYTKDSFSRILKLSAPLVLLSIIYLIARDNVLTVITTKIPVINNTLVLAKNTGEKYGTILFIMFLYFRNLIAPTNLSFDYGYAHFSIKQITEPPVIIMGLVFIWMLAFAIWKWREKNLFVWTIMLYIATLSVSSNVLITIAATMADRFLFLPSIAFCVAMAAIYITISKYSINAVKSDGNKFILMGFSAIMILFYSFHTYARVPVWENNYTLFKSGTTSAPNSYRTNRAFAVENLVRYNSEKDTAQKRIYLNDMMTYYERAMKVYDQVADDNFNIGIGYY